MFPPFESVRERLLESGYDNLVFRDLAPLVFEEADLKNTIKAFSGGSKAERENMLMDLASALRKSRLKPFMKKLEEQILTEAIVKAYDNDEINLKWRDKIFGHSNTESDLYEVLKRFIKRYYGLKPIPTFNRKDLPCGNPDIVAVKDVGILRKGYELLAFDAKVNQQALKRFYDQTYSYHRAFNYVWAVTTGWCAVREGEDHLLEKLRRTGSGLIYIDLEKPDNSKEILKPKESDHLETDLTKKVFQSL